MRRLVLVAAWTAYCLTLPPAAAEATCLKYWPSKVTVTGRLFERVDFGPPNYGESPETDARERHIYVALDKSMCVAAGDKQSDFAPAEHGLTTMQLVYFVDTKEFGRAWIGKRVRLKGTLFGAHTGHHMTPVLMTVAKTELLTSSTY